MDNKSENACFMTNRIFLGGACTSNWRDKLIPALDYYEINYFNPVIKNWTPESASIEEEEKNENCDIHLYYFDSTMTGMYSMAEMMKSCIDIETEEVDDNGFIHKSFPVNMVIYLVNTNGMSESQIQSFDASFRLACKVAGGRFYIRNLEMTAS